MFGRHRDVLLYIPNLIGEHQQQQLAAAGCTNGCAECSCSSVSSAGYARIGLTLGALACARQYPLLCVTTYFLA